MARLTITTFIVRSSELSLGRSLHCSSKALLNDQIKKVVCILSMQRLRVKPPFQKKTLRVLLMIMLLKKSSIICLDLDGIVRHAISPKQFTMCLPIPKRWRELGTMARVCE
jgi:hypothetical protein